MKKYYYIYLIRNKINNKVYIGKTIKNIQERFARHIYDVNTGSYGCPILHRAIKKYGKENFEVLELEKTEFPHELSGLERKNIIKYNSLTPNGYNIVLPSSGDNSYYKSSEYHINLCRARSQGKRRDQITTSDFVGVIKTDSIEGRTWEFRLRHKNKVFVGRTDTEIEAAIKYDKLAILFYGKNANLNLEKYRQQYLQCNLERFFNEEILPKYSSSYIGVSKSEKKWQASYKSIYIGKFNTEEEAAINRDKICYQLKQFNYKPSDFNFPDLIHEYALEENRHVLDNLLKNKKTLKDLTSSKYNGVWYRKDRKHYVATINTKKCVYRMGSYATEIEAAQAVDKCILYARLSTPIKSKLNFPEANYNKEDYISFCENKLKEQQRKREKYIGVSYSKLMKKYHAYITKGDFRYNLGYFDTDVEAAKAVDAKRLQIFKDNSRQLSYLNFPENKIYANLIC